MHDEESTTAVRQLRGGIDARPRRKSSGGWGAFAVAVLLAAAVLQVSLFFPVTQKAVDGFWLLGALLGVYASWRMR